MGVEQQVGLQVTQCRRSIHNDGHHPEASDLLLANRLRPQVQDDGKRLEDNPYREEPTKIIG
ncbi:hypothetical protein N007_00880 [Alicyclobacillus acidoterrestris ATCC 49025]|nr:hypothetical protein N007_00880 [Alicyclobacillus acidoterrestris ATCC 49025]